MYRLNVIHEGRAHPSETVELASAAAVLTTIPELLARHGDCLRIEVMAGPARLFAVDCHGQTLEG